MQNFKVLSKFPITLPYNKTNVNKSTTLYKTKRELGVRNFIKAYYSSKNEPFGLKGVDLKHIRDIISFISGFKSTKGVRISKILFLFKIIIFLGRGEVINLQLLT